MFVNTMPRYEILSADSIAVLDRGWRRIPLSPGSIAGQGYASEEIDSGLRILAVTTAWMKRHPVPPMIWSRHGLVPLFFDLPFLKLGKFLVSPNFVSHSRRCYLPQVWLQFCSGGCGRCATPA